MNDFLNRIATLSPKRLALLALDLHEQVESLKNKQREPIAVIGMGCRFPGGADSPQALWELLRAGRDAIVPAPEDRWDLEIPIDTLPDSEGRPARMQGGFLERVDLFDPLFFGISPREAESMDPQQRLLLEVAWEALENAALSADQIQGTRTGVFLGIAGSDFSHRLLDQSAPNLDGYVATGGSHAVAAGRLAYTLHLTGPCVSIDTACSSSLVAVSAACDSLRLGKSNLALAGGVSLILSPETTLVLARGGMLSPDFRCRAFDEAANGFVRGEGCGLVVLKRLSDAERDGDRIMALIRGTAVNQDGRSSGLTAPNGPAQQALLREALADAGLAPADIQFVEAHGTGTSLGDPIEAQALSAVYSPGRPSDQPLFISSVKTNFGHLESAAGIAGLLKLVLAIEHGEIPPLLHLNTPNPHVDWSNTRLALPTTAVPWPGNPAARAGGVSSFGFSGTNAHLVVSAAPEPTRSGATPGRPEQLLCLSAKSDDSLRSLAACFGKFLNENRDLSLADVAFTANAGRAHHEFRAAFIDRSNEQLREQLLTFAGGQFPTRTRVGKVERSQSSQVAFLFTGQGSQFPGMSRELYQTQPAFRAALDGCDELLRGLWNSSLLEVLFSDQSDESARLEQTEYTQPALFAVEYALAEMLRSWGVFPSAVLGHSVGEYAAACVAGVFSLEDGLRLIVSRARLMQSLPPGGGMVAALAPENDVVRALAPLARTLSIAAFNGPTNVVVAGPLADLDQFVRRLEAQGLPSQRLTVSHAFHSALLDPILDRFERTAEQVAYADPRFTVISNLTGQPATATELRSARYWRTHARQPVRFAAGVQALRSLGYTTFVEIGPTPILSGMARRVVTHRECRWLPTLRRGRGDWEQLLETLGELYTIGVKVDWDAFHRDAPRRKVSLPTYPFARSRYWPDVQKGTSKNGLATTTLDAAESFRDALYELEWEPLANSAAGSQAPSYLPSSSQLQEAASVEAEALYRELPPADDDLAYREIELLCRNYIIDAFATLGFVLRTGGRFSTDELRVRLGILDRHQRLFGRMLEILADDGLLSRHANEWVVVQTLVQESTEQQLQRLSVGHPQCEAELEVLGPCGKNLAGVLVGRMDPMQLLFPGGSLDLTAKLYYDTRPVALFNTLIERCLKEAVEHLPADRNLRILEIGAGTGGTTARVLPHLPAPRSSYVFTDVSTQFLDRAKKRFADYPFVEYRHFDLEQPASDQGLNAGEFDVIIAANVMHATRDLRRSLDQAKHLLKPEGLLVVLEVVRPQRFGDLTVGLTNGWWAFTDTAVRPNYALITENRWLEVLGDAGFVEPIAVPNATVERTGLFANQSILLAKKASESAPARMSTNGQAHGRWLVWADEKGIGRRLALQLRERGGECLVIRQGSQFEALGNDEYLIRPHCADDHAAIIEQYRRTKPADCRGAIYLWGLDARFDDEAPLAEVQAAVEQTCHGALQSAQAAARAGGLRGASLTFVTRGGQSAHNGHPAAEPAQAALWGLAGVVSLEHPELHCRRIDIDCSAESELALLTELLGGEREADQLALAGNSRRALRLKRAAASELCYPACRFRPDSSYLITGGLSGLGLETARWLVDHGARHLVLNGRGAAKAEAQRAIDAWRNEGIEVACVQADIGEPEGADRIFSAIELLRAPLKGVIHSAGALDDASLLHQNWPQHFRRVMKTKVDGAWNLHCRTRSMALDFFVLYSSGASLLGSVGQANHAAANAFLDGLAAYRRSRRLPALAINWGAWRDVGAASQHNVLKRSVESGVNSIALVDGFKALECLLASGSSRAAVLPIDWTRFSSDRPGVPGASLFTGLRAHRRRTAVDAVDPEAEMRRWREKLQSANAARRRIALGEMVDVEAMKVLGLKPPQTIDPRQPLQELGLDSLMAVQFRNTLAAWSGIELPATLLYNCPTVEQLTAHLFQQLTENAFLDDAPATEQRGGPTDEIDDLSEEDLVRLLEQQINTV